MAKNRDWRRIGAVTVRRYDKTARSYPTLRDAVVAIGNSYRFRAGVDFRELLKRGYLGVEVTSIWGTTRCSNFGDDYAFVDDDSGLNIPAWRVHAEWMNCAWDHGEPDPNYRNPGRNYHKPCRNRFQRGFAQHTSKRLRTTAERRENDFLNHHDEDALFYHIKARRASRCDLPTSWDDERSTRRSGNWKTYRRTQYRPH